MKRKSVLLLSVALTAISICSKGAELPSPNKRVEKITLNVNGKTHIVWVNKTMIDMVKNNELGEHQSSSIILPADYSEGDFSSRWQSFLQKRAIEVEVLNAQNQ